MTPTKGHFTIIRWKDYQSDNTQLEHYLPALSKFFLKTNVWKNISILSCVM